MKMNERQEITVDCAFPGGNILPAREEPGGFALQPDLRDTAGRWFYWCFRVRGAAGRRLRFRIESPGVVGVRGPGVSTDGGVNWRWLGAGSDPEHGSFTYRFAPGEDEVLFSFGMPYQEADLERFLAGRAGIRAGHLCRSREGRPVELLRFGRLDGAPSFRMLITCRHHACEMMANYVLEGLIDALNCDERLRRSAAFCTVPFVDKDGVENGDQGKNRSPHDHGRDYAPGGSIYPETGALRDWARGWFDGTPAVALDIHCPGSRGQYHECVLLPTRARSPENWQRMRPFLKMLEDRQSGELAFRLSDSEEFETWDGKPYRPHPHLRGFSAWAEELEGMVFATSLEIPYANANGREVNQETARIFGADLGAALRGWLEEAGIC